MLTNPDILNFAQPNPNQEIARHLERIAIGLDMLVGLLAEQNNMELEEVKHDGVTLLRWRPCGAEEAEGQGEESSDSEA